MKTLEEYLEDKIKESLGMVKYCLDNNSEDSAASFCNHVKKYKLYLSELKKLKDE